MPRFIGYDPSSNTAALSAVWNINQVFSLRKATIWPDCYDRDVFVLGDVTQVTNASGTFIVVDSSKSFTMIKSYSGCDVIVVGGGGGGGGTAGEGQQGGGGGAGALRRNTNATIRAGAYTATIGLGGAGGTQTTRGTNGGTSSLSTPGTSTSFSSAPGGGGGGLGASIGSPLSPLGTGLPGGSGGGAGGQTVRSGGSGSVGGNGGSSFNDAGGQGGGTLGPGLNAPFAFPATNNDMSTAANNGIQYYGTHVGVGGFGGWRYYGVGTLSFYGSGGAGTTGSGGGNGNPGVPGVNIIKLGNQKEILCEPVEVYNEKST